MASRWFIINDWFHYDLKCRNGPEQKEQCVQFLKALINGPDGIVIIQNGLWLHEIIDWINRENRSNVNERLLRRQFFGMLYLDSQKCKILKGSEINELPPKLRCLLDQKKIDNGDEFMMQIWYSSPVKVEYIITTDCRLMNALDKFWPDIKTRHRDDFLAEYLAR